MGQIDDAWGSGPSDRYDSLAAVFRPIFARIAEGAVERELGRVLPFEEIGWLKEARFGALRIPEEKGGFGATIPELFNLLTELSAADSNITQALRVHFGFVEDVMNSRDVSRRERWFARLVQGEIVGSAWTEIGGSKQAVFSTSVVRDGDRWRLNGAKYYTTGSLFADWIDVGAQGEGEDRVAVIVRRDAPGVVVQDDWDGFGQILTASGSATFTDVVVHNDEVLKEDDRLAYGQAFVQLVHLATLTGIGRAAAAAIATAVGKRERNYSHSAGPRPNQDPQVLQIVGHVRAAAYCAGAIVLKTAEALQRVFAIRFSDNKDAEEAANNFANIEAAQAQTIVTNLILEATSNMFDALGASATRKTAALDRFWRNARTLSSHNPRIYKDRIVGDFAVNGTQHPPQWRIGKVS